ncbi:MAG: EAL domain-containing protein [Clostridia bacterium]|nr:EAL domain-containing protein [Clostridia bacterium]
MIFGISYDELKTIYINLISILVIFLIGMIAYRYSILNKIREQKIMKKQAYTDPLTCGGNRQLFLKVVDNLIGGKNKFALCFLDLDGFKQINDTLGHDAGDELLKKLYDILSNSLMKKNGTVYRLGGDEFAIILTHVETTEDIAKVLDKIKLDLRTPIVIENTNILLEYSLGVAIYPSDADNRKDLLSYADDAMYYIKEHGKNNYYFHNKVLKAKQENKNKMEADLKKAFREGQFGVELQPRFNLKDTSEIIFEALLYWNHPVLGHLKAEYFIKQAEELGLIIKLDEFVLEKCLEKLNEVKKKGFNNVKIAVNNSNKHSKRSDFVDSICNIIEKHSIEKGLIQIEYTDIIKVSEIENYRSMFGKLKNIGVNICITNLEIEHDTLSLVADLPIDEMKLNVQYIKEDSKFNKNILKDLIRFSKDLGYNVTVTHVETKEEFTKLISSDVDNVQGNFLSNRIKLNMLGDYLKQYSEYKASVDNIIRNI